jgi:hypothetical protein
VKNVLSTPARRPEQWLASVRITLWTEERVVKLLLWLVVLFFCWPLALAALVLYPLVWILLLPFRVVGIAVEGALELVWALVTLPARVIRSL